ncbi:N-acetylmuramoyl-L-alanine amidase [Patescibacteria group bacterium]|nr:N-acetylmuramoyl-L-alanine amidase [Patescibacteria group bacterium]
MHRIVAVFLLCAVAVPFAYVHAAFPVTSTKEDLLLKYEAAAAGGEKVRILVMPGHEPEYGGAEYRTLKERDIAVEIANKIAAHLEANPRYEVIVARDTLAWHPELEGYFDRNWKGIQRFVKDKKKEMQKMLRKGAVEEREFQVEHNAAATDVALRLYGINKWANEYGIDLAIHVHLNDHMGHGLASPGVHSGFAVYVPDEHYGNASGSTALGEALAKNLNKWNATSTLPIENYGVVPSQSLIAMGSNNTAEFATVLVEYAYIYESKITYPEARGVVTDDFAYQTYKGVEEFFGNPVLGDYTLALPYVWKAEEIEEGTASPQIYALQVALHSLGFYPPAGELLIGCPVSGYAGPCTTRALKVFQASKGLEQTGSIGPRTKAALQASGL